VVGLGGAEPLSVRLGPSFSCPCLAGVAAGFESGVGLAADTGRLGIA